MRIALPPRIDPHVLDGHDRAAPVIALDGETMGTTWRATIAIAGAVDPAGVRDAIVARLASLVAEMSHWQPESLLSRFNRSAAGDWTTLPADFAQVMTVGLRVAAMSGGAFDPARGRLVDLWGHGPPGPRPRPDAAAIETVLAAEGWTRLAWGAPAARLRQPGGLSLDLSGIAKGHAVDVIADLLTARGLRHALVEIGGELVGRGIRPDGEPWWVDLETPAGIELPPLRIALHGLAVATSGTYRRGDHTLDPRTGRPADRAVLAASVVAATACEADAWATALTVLGSVEGLALAERHGIAARLITRGEEDGSGIAREWLSAPLCAMLDD